jgi:hypothetical protein
MSMFPGMRVRVSGSERRPTCTVVLIGRIVVPTKGWIAYVLFVLLTLVTRSVGAEEELKNGAEMLALRPRR